MRPAPGWQETTGAVYGTVLAADYGAEPASTIVMVARLGLDGRPHNAVNRITNAWGQFVIEGLAAGDYVVTVYGAFERYRQYVPIRQTVRLEPVRVRARERTGPLILTARRPDELE